MLSLPPPLLSFYIELMPYDMEYSFGQFGSAVLVMSSAKILPPRLLVGGWNGGETALMLCRAAQQQPKHWCVTNTFVGTNAKHSTVRAPVEK